MPVIEEGLSFRCKECGSDELRVEHDYSITEEIVKTLECGCDDENEFAAQQTIYVTTSYVETSPLDEDHRIGPTEDTETLDTDYEKDDLEVLCHKCFDEAEEGDWTSETESSEVDEDSHEFYVRCAGCDREIEFGWSHPGRGGRIWPAESKDFNPWKSWPEPRYRDKWLEKGWIRPDLR